MVQANDFVQAVANGNTFFIVDLINRVRCFSKSDEERMVAYHKSFGQDRVDSCLVLERYPVIPRPDDDTLVVQMRVYYPEGGFCGNGSRAVCHYLHATYPDYKHFLLRSEHAWHPMFMEDGIAFAGMGATSFGVNTHPELVDVNELKSVGTGADCAELVVNGVHLYVGETGEPHVVTADDITDEEFLAVALTLNGPKFRNIFPKGTCVNRTSKVNNTAINVKTWERGVDRFTQACGSGSTTCVQLMRRLGHISGADDASITVHVPGGDLTVRFVDGAAHLGGNTLLNTLED